MNADVVADALRALWGAAPLATSPAMPVNLAAARHQRGEVARAQDSLSACAALMLSVGEPAGAEAPLNAVARRNQKREAARIAMLQQACARDVSGAAVLPGLDAEQVGKCRSIAAMLTGGQAYALR